MIIRMVLVGLLSMCPLSAMAMTAEEAEEMGRLMQKPYQDLERAKQRTQESMNNLERLRQQDLTEQRMRQTPIGQCYFVPGANGRQCQVCVFPNGQYNTVCN